ncbi:Soluble quinoprotein glucose/sorbosone dehydrogenase [Lasallia pustulata]|uniref:Soluble quinoprotein glucose/sorbosone dehydrogenase n=1 Tax=Lasallia pustulata TaxID=136370 RepID=A0A1W5CU43_9LECA|nr:Soluble quinoprotein glucose/sorbosone dehydrogenase [Lasallia pustulata]
MRLSSLFSPTAAEIASVVRLWLIWTHLAVTTQGVSFDPVSTNLDLSQLGRVALAGDFDAISLYTYQQQSENSFSANGSQSLIIQMPNGAFASLGSADADIMAMCEFVMKNGQSAGVVVGGNFTSFDGLEAQGVALYNPTTSQITPLPGLSGKVTALLCDQETNTVYVGGEFKGANSTNAVIWIGTTGWANLPFAGFNGPVSSIVKAPNGNVIFGGSFNGLGNTTTPINKDQQVVNLQSAIISAGSSTITDGFSDPTSIICKTSGQDGAGNTWLLADNTPGYWEAQMNFGGTKTFRFTAFPINGIMNFTYADPATGQNATCDARCPLSSNISAPYTDFRFVNVIGMNGFRIDISDWYGSGGGLDGVELFQDDIYAYAVGSLNEPSCANINLGSNSTTTGPWSVTPSGQSTSEYLTADLTGPNIDSGSASVVFMPDIKQAGNYSVTVYTPGCQQDNTCSTRGIANISGVFASGVQPGVPVPTQVYQTNYFDKYDQIYHGYVDANSDSFRPTVTLTPASGQNNGITLVAQRVRFQLLESTGGINGLFEYNPNQATIDTDFSNSSFDQAGTNLVPGATITSLTVTNGKTYIGGNFSGNGFENIFAVTDGNSTSLPGGGLNAAVSTTFVFEDLLYIGGNFTNTATGATPGLNNVAAFNTSSQAWQALGAGVNGRVNSIVPLILNITSGQPETCITLNGNFDQVLASGSSNSTTVHGLAVWVPSHKNWLQNLNIVTTAVSGQLTAAVNVSSVAEQLLAGTISSQGLGIVDTVELSTVGPLTLNSLGVNFQPQQVSSSSMRKRAVSGQNVTGAVTGLFYNSGGLNVTVLGGHFTATASNGSDINNLIFINATSGGGKEVTGIGSGLTADSVFLALATQGSTLYAGGTISGSIGGSNTNGLILYDLARATYSSPQPPALVGSNVAVNAISTRPNTAEVYVGGKFDSAGSFSCPSVCMFESGQWNRPGSGLGGSVAAMIWQGSTQLLAGGNLTVSSNATSLAAYDAKAQRWSAVQGAANAVPGPVTALSPANNDGSQFWVAGEATNGSAFLIKYDGSNFQSIGDVLGARTTIRGLSILQLSKNHGSNSLVSAQQTLLVTGQLELPNFGNASAALFNGTTFTPFILSNAGNGPGSLSQVFSEKQMDFAKMGGHMALGLVVLIALACALGAIFLLVVAGIFIERYRRKAEGYHSMPNSYPEKPTNMGRIPPEHLFGSLGQGSRAPGATPLI